MFIIAPLVAALIVMITTGIWMYRLTENHNLTCDQAHYVEPSASAVFTAFFPALAAPYYFYRMRGPVGLAHGVGLALAVIMSSALLSEAGAFLIS